MTFIQVRKAILNNECLYAYLCFKRTTVRISKTPKPTIQKCKYALEGGLFWEINQTKHKHWSGWEEIRESAEYKCRTDWQFTM